MPPRLIAFLLLLATPFTLATSQGMGGGGMGGGRHGGGHHSPGDSTSGRPDLVAARAALERLGFAGLVLQHKAALQLTDSQVVALTQMQSQFRIQTDSDMHELDSLRAANVMAVQAMVANHDTLTAAQRDTIVQRRHLIASLLGHQQDVEQQTRQHALAILTPVQQQQATTFETLAEEGRSGSGGGGRGHGSKGT
jgi:hypothetical protein